MNRATRRSRSRMRRCLSGRGAMALTFVLGLVIASATTAGAASLISGSQIKNGTIAKQDLSKAVRKQLARTGAGGAAGPQGAQGAQGPAGSNGAPGARGTNGTNGTNGSNATIKGVAAGGDLAGAFPNPTIKPGAVRTAAFDTAAVAPDSAKLGGVDASSYVTGGGKITNAAGHSTLYTVPLGTVAVASSGTTPTAAGCCTALIRTAAPRASGSRTMVVRRRSAHGTTPAPSRASSRT